MDITFQPLLGPLKLNYVKKEVNLHANSLSG